MERLFYRGENDLAYSVETFDIRQSVEKLLAKAYELGIGVDPDFKEIIKEVLQPKGKLRVRTIVFPSGKVFGSRFLDMDEMVKNVGDISKRKLTVCPDPVRTALLDAINYKKGRNQSRDACVYSVMTPVVAGRFLRCPRVAAVVFDGSNVSVHGLWAQYGFGPRTLLRLGFPE